MTELTLAERFDEQGKVIDLYLQGQNETQIAKTTGLKRKDVISHLTEWREVIRTDDTVREMAKQHLYGMSVHYQRLIAKLYEVIDEVDDALQGGGINATAPLLAQKTNALKQIADLEEKRIKLEREAGLLEDNSLADEILETERKQEALVEFLRDVSSNCPHCKDRLRKFMSDYNNKTEEVPLPVVVNE